MVFFFGFDLLDRNISRSQIKLVLARASASLSPSRREEWSTSRGQSITKCQIFVGSTGFLSCEDFFHL